MTTSTIETSPMLPARCRSVPTTRSGIAAMLGGPGAVVGPQQVAQLGSSIGEGSALFRTRIISSGVTPFAVMLATKEPALVPT